MWWKYCKLLFEPLDYHSFDDLNRFNKVKFPAFSGTCGCEDI